MARVRKIMFRTGERNEDRAVLEGTHPPPARVQVMCSQERSWGWGPRVSGAVEIAHVVCAHHYLSRMARWHVRHRRFQRWQIFGRVADWRVMVAWMMVTDAVQGYHSM